MEIVSYQNFDLIELSQVDSTNRFAREWLTQNKPTKPLVIFAHEQSAGRGQQGTSWVASPGENLTFSLVMCPEIRVTDQFILNQAVVLGIINYLRTLGIEAKVKWPNDIFYTDRKLAGILIENMIRGEWLSTAVIGIGLNVNQKVFDIHKARPISTFQVLGRELDLKNALQACSDSVISSVLQYRREALDSDYLQQLYNFGQPQEFQDKSGNKFVGTIEGVEETGRLIVKLPNGMLKKFVFKEIEYIFAP